MPVRSIAVLLLVIIARLPAGAQAAKLDTAGKTQLVVGRDDFQQLRWIAGNWRGESESDPALYARYRFVDDSTLVSETFSDSKFRTLKESLRFELRNHRVTTRGGTAQWVMTSIDSGSAAFRHLAGTTDDFVWQRHDDNEWLAAFASPPGVDHPARTTTYHMKRVKGD
jgi:hypothetical protein